MRAKTFFTITAVTMFLLVLISMAGSGGTSSYASASTAGSPQTSHLWTDANAASLPKKSAQAVLPNRYRALVTDEVALRALLASAPSEGATAVGRSNVILDLPMPNGSIAHYRVVESTVMEPGLAAKFPEIKTYLAQGIEDRTATMRLDFTPAGFHAMSISAAGTVYVDPYSTYSESKGGSNGNTANYISYYRQDYPTATELGLSSTFSDQHRDVMGAGHPGGDMLPTSPSAPPTGNNLRTYRLAMAATSLYTADKGGTVPSAMAAIVTMVNRLNEVFERELSIRMVLVNNNDRIVYANAATDPYNGVDELGNTNQAKIDEVIGTANYDIGHLVTKRGGGAAYVGVVCGTTLKANGYSGNFIVSGDALVIDVVAHEIGHQFGAQHTFNGSTGGCGSNNREANHAYEPGSGSTIMTYPGSCGPEDLQPHADPYFHTASYDDIINFVSNSQTGGSCGTVTATGNNPPVIGALPNYVVPANTYFQLTGSATDPDNDALTYSWEEFDLGTQSPPQGDDGSRPIFRSFPPSSSPTRYFPKLQDILTKNDGALSFGEWVPTTNRTMQFRLTARDNRAGGGGVNYGQASVQVVASQGATNFGPFKVTAPNTAVFWPASSQQTVTWNVANTDQAPVNCANVNILLSTDGGQTFPTSLAANTANDGTETITVPNVSGSSARVEVACAGNVFFDTSNVNFRVGDPNIATDTPQPQATATTITPPEQEEYIEGQVQPGGRVTTDGENNGATGEDPVETTVQSPNAGMVGIVESRPGDTGAPSLPNRPAATGTPESYFGQQVGITAPAASAANPMSITFFLDSSIVPYKQDRFTIDIYKNDILVPNCANQSGAASPDPCVYSRTLFGGDDAEITVLSSSSGTWNFDEGTNTCSTQFRDVDPSNAFNTYIHCLACRNVISGYSDGTFRPGALVTRGQIAKIVANGLGLTEPITGQTFEDVKPTGQTGASPFYQYIEFLTRAGYMGGYACEDPATHPGTDIPCVAGSNRPYFRPGSNATRGQISKIVSNAADYQDTPTGQTFTDVPTNSPFYTWIQRLASRGHISGYACGGTNPQTGSAEPCDSANRPWFRPNNSVTRGQTTKIVANAILPDCAIPTATARK